MITWWFWEFFAAISCCIARAGPYNLLIGRHPLPCTSVAIVSLLSEIEKRTLPAIIFTEATRWPTSLRCVWTLPRMIRHIKNVALWVSYLCHYTIRSTSVSTLDSDGSGWCRNLQSCQLVPCSGPRYILLLTVNENGSDIVTDYLQLVLRVWKNFWFEKTSW